MGEIVLCSVNINNQKEAINSAPFLGNCSKYMCLCVCVSVVLYSIFKKNPVKSLGWVFGVSLGDAEKVKVHLQTMNTRYFFSGLFIKLLLNTFNVF